MLFKKMVEKFFLICLQRESKHVYQDRPNLNLDLFHSLCRRMTKFSDNYIQTVASRTTSSLEQTLNVQTEKFTDFEVNTLSMTSLKTPGEGSPCP